MNRRSFAVQRPLVLLACFFGLGIYVGGSWHRSELLLVWAGLACAVLAGIALLRARKSPVFAIGFVLFFAALLYAQAIAQPALPPPGDYAVQARVSGLAEQRERDGRVSATLRDVSLRDDAGKVYQTSGAYFTYYPDQDTPLLMDGQSLTMRSRLYHPSGRQNPYGFDFRLYLLQKSIPIGFSGAKELVLSPETLDAPQSLWLRLREHLAGVLEQVLSGEAGLVQALLLGSKAELPEEALLAFRNSGLAHLLSVSGLHVSILSLWLMWLLKRLHLSPRLRLALVFAFLLAYCRLLDFAAPVVRASILSLCLLLGRLLHRRSDPLTGLAIAFVLILLWQPLELFSVGFQLSFLAVLGIFTLGDRLTALYLRWRGERRRPLLDRVVSAMIITLAATLFTAPVSMRVFHQFSLVGLIISPLACALVALLLPYSLFLLLVGLAYMPLAVFLAPPAQWVSALLGAMARLSSALPGAVIRSAAPPLLLMLGIYALLLLLSRYSLLRIRWRVALALALLLPPMAAMLLWQDTALRYTQLSTGNADAAVIEDASSTYVIDTSEHGGDLSAYLLSRGRRVDTLFITHLHYDHVGGLQQMLDAGVPIAEIVLPYGALDAELDPRCPALIASAQAQGIAVRHVAAGDGFTSGRLSMRVLWPVAGRLYPGLGPNHGSLAMLWDLDGVSLLTTGDLTKEYETYAAEPAQMLKIAHHGSRGSTADGFLDTVQPQIALLSISEPQLGQIGPVVERLKSRECRVLDTGSGALQLRVEAGEIRARKFAEGGRL